MSFKVVIFGLLAVLGADAGIGTFKKYPLSNMCDTSRLGNSITMGPYLVTAQRCYDNALRLYILGVNSAGTLTILNYRDITSVGSPVPFALHKTSETSLLLVVGQGVRKAWEIMFAKDASTITLGRTSDQYTPVPWDRAISMTDTVSNRTYFIGSGANATNGFYYVDLTPYIPLRINRVGNANFGDLALGINTISNQIRRPYGFLLNQSSMATYDISGNMWQGQAGGEDKYDWFLWVDQAQDLAILSGTGAERHNVQMFNVATGRFGETFDIYWNVWDPAVKDNCLYYIAQTTPEHNTLFQMQIPTSMYGPTKLLAYTDIPTTNRLTTFASPTDSILYILDTPNRQLYQVSVTCS